MRLPAVLAVSALLHAALVLWLATPRAPAPRVMIEAVPVAVVFDGEMVTARGAEEPAGGEATAPEMPPPPVAPPPMQAAEVLPPVAAPVAPPRPAADPPDLAPARAASPAVAPVPRAASPTTPGAVPPSVAVPPVGAPEPVAAPLPSPRSVPTVDLATPMEPQPPVPPPASAVATALPVPPASPPRNLPAAPGESDGDDRPPAPSAGASADPALPMPPPAPPPMPAVRLAAGLATLPALRGPAEAPAGLSRGPVVRDTGCGGAFTYPDAARRLGAQGTVLLRLSVRADGTVAAAEVVQGSGFPVLDRAAREGALRCRFDPALQGGRPVAGSAPWRVTYRIAP